MNGLFKTYLLPGLVFQSVIIGGGYGTGREIMQFFLSHGALGGLFGLVVTALAWGLILAVAFEFARINRGYDYRSFFTALIGPFWRVFEVLYLLIALLVLSVLGSAAGEMIADGLGAPPILGVMGLLASVGALAFFGGDAIERVMTAWSFLLYAVYGVFIFWVAARFGDDMIGALSQGEATGAWFFDGVRYAAYNLIALVAVLFVLPYIKTRKEAIFSGFFAGLAGIIPAGLVFMALLSQYPAISTEPVPVLTVLKALNAVWFLVLFQVVLFGTFIETGAGVVHAINQRVASTLGERNLDFPHWARLGVAAGLLAISIFLARAIGLIDLIAKGYGVLSIGFIVVVIAPLLTIGVYKIAATKSNTAEAASDPR